MSEEKYERKQRLSEKYGGKLNLSEKENTNFQQYLKDVRNEWQRGYLMDSNPVIDYLNGNLPPSGMAFVDNIVNDAAMISVITKIEVAGYRNANMAAQKMIAEFIDDTLVFDLTDDIVNKNRYWGYIQKDKENAAISIYSIR